LIFCSTSRRRSSWKRSRSSFASNSAARRPMIASAISTMSPGMSSSGRSTKSGCTSSSAVSSVDIISPPRHGSMSAGRSLSPMRT